VRRHLRRLWSLRVIRPSASRSRPGNRRTTSESGVDHDVGRRDGFGPRII
jgi:hypothetical protein